MCTHPSRLIYFDRFNTVLESWEVCDECGEKFNVETHMHPGDAPLLDEWSTTYYTPRSS